jgi:DNA polymerase, archaea type
MAHSSPIPKTQALEWLEGWDDTPGIVSVCAELDGLVHVWRRVNGELNLEQDRFRPWVYAKHLQHVQHLGSRLSDNTGTMFSYTELPGKGAFKYLLETTHWRALRTALIRGANDANLREHPDYYIVGLTEQYLMASGRVCFRGLEYTDLVRLQFDLETTALKPEDGQIFMIAVRDSGGFEAVLEGDERSIIQKLVRIINHRDPDVIENHNLMGFDLPFLEVRAKVCGVPLEFGRLPSTIVRKEGERFSVPGRELIDTLDAVWRHDFVTRELPSHRLKDVAKHYGLAAQDRVYIEGSSIASEYVSNPERVRAYALEDVREVSRLSERLLPASFALTKLAPRRFERVSSAGTATGILEPMLVRAYHHAKRALPSSETRYLETPHEGGAVFLFKEGLVRNVVKADIASLYPSVMRAFEIGPSCDELGVMTSLVKQMLETRLDHKARAKTTRGTPAFAHHDAMQAALKLVLNSAYGYLGAGSMALFGDRPAADQITAIGREILDQVIFQLRDAGVMLLEADTDGVFFASNLLELDARALVGRISDSLPTGITLEFDDLYPAMLSHDIKNYALLKRDGSVTLRGVNYRSSRFEPFANVFIERSVRAALENDVNRVREIFLETRDLILNRQLCAKDVTTRAKLKKTPLEYAQSRHKMRETAYEAMGTRTWARGERIRFYRASGNRLVALPADETTNPEEFATDYDAQHYCQQLERVYAKKLEKAFTSEMHAKVFGNAAQEDLFSSHVELKWL